jgi:flagellar biosynthesis protein FlhF
MRISSIFAPTVGQALERARRELGPDAMLIRARRAPAKNRHLGAFEVVFGLNGADAAEPAPVQSTENAQIAAIRKQMDELRALLDGTAGQQDEAATPDAAETAANVEEESIPDIDPAVRESIRELARPGLGLTGNGGIAVFVGPPGAGKTSTVLKVAAKTMAAGGRPLIVSYGEFRVAFHSEVSRHASLLKIPCLTADALPELRRALAQAKDHRPVLIDTPGYCAAQDAAAGELAAFLSSYDNLLTHLVLTAHTPGDVQQAIIDRFTVFEPDRLVFSRLDETIAFDTAFEVASANELPISYLGCGQQVPDDLLPAAESTLIQLLEEDVAARIRRAA